MSIGFVGSNLPAVIGNNLPAVVKNGGSGALVASSGARDMLVLSTKKAKGKAGIIAAGLAALVALGATIMDKVNQKKQENNI